MATGKASILVTGGAGFIGSHVVEALVAREQRVVCLDNFDSFYDPHIKRANLAAVSSRPNLHLIEGDIRDRSVVEGLCDRYAVDRIFHAAARAGVRPSVQDPLLYEDVNVRGTLSMLEVARSRSIKTFVFASSSSVYGGLETVPFTEAAPLSRPISPYAATKLAGELLCYTYHHLYGLPVTCLRFFTVYGPRQRPEMAIHQFVRLIQEGKPLPVFGDGSARRDFTYIDDVVQGVLASLETPFAFEIFNLGESETIALMDLIQLIEETVGKKAELQTLPAQQGDMLVTYADITKARHMLKYRPTTPVKAGLKKFVEWFRTSERGTR